MAFLETLPRLVMQIAICPFAPVPPIRASQRQCSALHWEHLFIYSRQPFKLSQYESEYESERRVHCTKTFKGSDRWYLSCLAQR